MSQMRDEEMQQRGEESGKLNGQLTGLGEIKLPESIKGGEGVMVSEHTEHGVGAQSNNKHCIRRGKTGKWGCDKSSDSLPFLIIQINLTAAILQLQQHIQFSNIQKHTLHIVDGPAVCLSSAGWLSDMQDYSDLLWLSSRQLGWSRFL